MKWIGFRKRRKPLNDLQLVDDAGRGPLGSFLLTLRYKGRSLECIGAIVIILALTFDPFMQQILSYPVRQTLSTDLRSSFKRATTYPLLDHDGIDIKDAVYAGIWTDNFETDPICPSGNCTFPPFRSTGWCSKCEEITSRAGLEGCIIPNQTLGTTQRFTCSVILPEGQPSRTFIQRSTPPVGQGSLTIPVEGTRI